MGAQEINNEDEISVDDAAEQIDAAAREVQADLLSTSILHIVPYLEPGAMDGVTYKGMADELPKDVIEHAKERMLHDLRIRIAKKFRSEKQVGTAFNRTTAPIDLQTPSQTLPRPPS